MTTESTRGVVAMTSARTYPDPNFRLAKRKLEDRPRLEQQAKKPHLESENYDHNRPKIIDTEILPKVVPLLPQISDEYEKIVFTHPSIATSIEGETEMVNYDKLEFLGDAYIEIIASRTIFDNYNTVSAGGMSKLRESVVKNETLSKYSIMYGFDKKLRITAATIDPRKGWTKIYGDVFEAYAAAVVLSDPEGGQARLERWLKELWRPVLREVNLPAVGVKAKEELAKKIKHKDIKINYVDERAPTIHRGQGRETFFIGVYLDGWGWKNQHLGSGQGPNKMSAGQEAAYNALNNHPLIDQVIAKKDAFMEAKRKEEAERIEAESNDRAG